MAARYWEVQGDEGVVVRYEDGKPAILERQLGQGRVLLYTTGLDGRKDNDNWYWNNYMASSFLMVLADKSMAYLVGDLDRPSLNRICGENVMIAVPSLKAESFHLQGPGVTGAASIVPRPEKNEVLLRQAVAAGNYTLFDHNSQIVAGFTLNVKPEESDLTRVDPEKIVTLFGQDSVVTVERSGNLRDKIKGANPPLDMVPWLMILLLLVLAAENLLANKFYRGEGGSRAKDISTTQ
jgi:hypothetical protein